MLRQSPSAAGVTWPSARMAYSSHQAQSLVRAQVESTHKCLQVPSVSARFSTAPQFWNLAMLASARWTPKGFLANANKYVTVHLHAPRMRHNVKTAKGACKPCRCKC